MAHWQVKIAEVKFHGEKAGKRIHGKPDTETGNWREDQIARPS
jgi:hypothetical protein